MERHAFAMKVKEGKMNDYRKNLGEIWPELTAYLDRNGIHNFSIWNAADLIFGYYENADGEVISPEEEKVKAALTEKIGDTFTWISTPGKDMRLMYHNFGVVRENKELIRHRML
ncbi:MAG: L-rhamnose mutarotase [Clostridium sp.]